MKSKHWTIVGAAVSGLALQLMGLPDWHHITPQFVAGAVLAICATVSGIRVDPPAKKDDNTVSVPRP